MSILKKITEKKKERVAYAKSRIPAAELKSIIKESGMPRDLQKAIKRDSGNIRFIAEIKKASPSKGLIRNVFDHIEIASIYENKKIDAISVITEEDFFQGRLAYLKDIKKITASPVLRKDFIFDEYQIYEARANMADAILLIASILELNQAEEYLHLSHELGMSVLFEVHDFEELETALRINSPVIGINNRSLETFQIDFDTSLKLKKEIPENRITVCESGIKTRSDVMILEKADFDAMLIGTSFMESSDIGKKIDELRGSK